MRFLQNCSTSVLLAYVFISSIRLFLFTFAAPDNSRIIPPFGFVCGFIVYSWESQVYSCSIEPFRRQVGRARGSTTIITTATAVVPAYFRTDRLSRRGCRARGNEVGGRAIFVHRRLVLIGALECPFCLFCFWCCTKCAAKLCVLQHERREGVGIGVKSAISM